MEEQSRLYYDAFASGANPCAAVGPSLAETILFPQHEDSESSSEEDSDWIVSDGEAEYVDLKQMLAETDSSEAGTKIVYHPEGGRSFGAGDSVSERDLDFLPLPLIEAVCGDGGVEAIRKVLEVNSDAYTLEATDDKGTL